MRSINESAPEHSKDLLYFFIHEKPSKIHRNDLLPSKREKKPCEDASGRLHKLRVIFKNELNVYTLFLESQESDGIPFYESFIHFLFQVEETDFGEGLDILNKMTQQIVLQAYHFQTVYRRIEKEMKNKASKFASERGTQILIVLYKNIWGIPGRAGSFFYMKGGKEGVTLAPTSPEFKNWPFEAGYSIILWFCRAKMSPNPSSSTIFVFHAGQYGGIEAFLLDQRLFIRITGTEYTVPGPQHLHESIEVGEIDYDMPYMLGIDHQKRLLRRSFTLTINGREIIKDASIDLPKVPAMAPLTKCALFERFIGKAYSAIISSGGSIPSQTHASLFESFKEGIQSKKSLKTILYSLQKMTKTLSVFTPISCSSHKSLVQDILNVKFMGKLGPQSGVVNKDGTKMHLRQYHSFTPVISLLLLICEETPEKSLPNAFNSWLQLLNVILKKPNQNQTEAVNFNLFPQISAILQSLKHPAFDEESIELLAELRVSLIDERLNMDLFTGVLLNKNIYTKLPFQAQISLFQYLRTIYNEHAALYVRHFDVGHIVRDITSFLNDSTQNIDLATPEEADKTRELCRAMFEILEGIFFSTKEEVIEGIVEILKQVIYKTSSFLKKEFLMLIEKIVTEKKKQSEHIYSMIMDIFLASRGIELFLDVALNSSDSLIQTKCIQFIALLSSHKGSRKNSDSSDKALKYFCVFATEKIRNFEKIQSGLSKHKEKKEIEVDPESSRFRKRRLSDIIDGSPKARDVFPSKPIEFMDDAKIPQSLSLSRGPKNKFSFNAREAKKVLFPEEKKEEPKEQKTQVFNKTPRMASFKDKKPKILLDIEGIEADNPVSGDAMRERATPRTLARQKGEIFELAAELANSIRAGTRKPASPCSHNQAEDKKESENEMEEEEEEPFELAALPTKIYRPPKAIPQTTRNLAPMNTLGCAPSQTNSSAMPAPVKSLPIKEKNIKMTQNIDEPNENCKISTEKLMTEKEIPIKKNDKQRPETVQAPFEITEELYTTILKWGLNKGSIPFEASCALDEGDSIEHPGAITLLTVLCNSSKSMQLKQQLFIDLSLLFQYSYTNTKMVLEEMPSFLEWLLDMGLNFKGEGQIMEALIERTIVSTLCSCLKNDASGLELVSASMAWVESKVAKKEPKTVTSTAQAFVKKIYLKTLNSLLDQAQTMFPLSMISPFWRNIVKFVFLVFDLIFVNPPILSQKEEELTLFPWSSLNNGILCRLKPYIILESEEWTDVSLLSPLVKIGEFFWKDASFSCSVKNAKEITTISRKISALLDVGLKRQFASEFDMLMKFHDAPFKSPLRWIQAIQFSHCVLLEHEINQIKLGKTSGASSADSIFKLLQSFEKMVNYFLVLCENSKDSEPSGVPINPSPESSKFMTGFILGSLAFLLEHSISESLPPQISSLFLSTLQSIFMYIMLIIDCINAKHGTFNFYQGPQQSMANTAGSRKRKNMTSFQGEQKTSCSYSLVTHEIVWEFMKMPNGEPMINAETIQSIKSKDLHELETVLVSGNLRRALLKNENTLSAIAEANRYSPMEEIKSLIKSLRTIVDEKSLLENAQKSKNKTIRNEFEKKMSKLHEECFMHITTKEFVDEILQRITVHRALSVVKKGYNAEQMFNGYLSPGVYYFQNSVAFRGSLWSYEQMKKKSFKRSLINMQTKSKTRPFLRIVTDDTAKLVAKEITKQVSSGEEKSTDEDILNPNHVFRQEENKTDSADSSSAGTSTPVNNSQADIVANQIKRERKKKESDVKVRTIGKSIFKALMPTVENASVSTSDKQALPAVERDKRFRVNAIYECEMVKTLTLRKGYFAVSKSRLYFLHHSIKQSKPLRALKQSTLTKWDQLLKIWQMNFVKDVQIRRFLMKKTGLEIFFIDGKSILINLKTESALNEFTDFILNHKRLFPNLVFSKTFAPNRLPESTGATKKWQDRTMSNFEYLLFLNQAASRSYLDLSQFPVFPWVLGVCSGNTLDFSNPGIFRDLSKPMGALGPESRTRVYLDRFETGDPFNSGHSYHYGSHYSNPAIVCQYMIRLDPYTSGGLEIQNGNFDLPDRIFASIDEGYKGATEEGSDVRELIPEFFHLPEFLLNIEKHDFGMSQTRHRVNHIVLPKWAKENPYLYVANMRKALECERVSASLHSWIDLIFGYKQLGEEAVKEMNVFYPITYEDVYNSVPAESIDSELKEARESQLFHFGQTPINIFSKPHPKRTGKLSFYKTVADPTAQMTIYKPKMLNARSMAERGPDQPNFTWLNLPSQANVLMKFVGDKTIVVMKRSGRLLIYRWWSSPIDRMPEDKGKLTFTNGLEVDDVALKLEETSFENILVFDRSVSSVKLPAAMLDGGKKLLIGGYLEGKMAVFSVDSGFLLKIYSRHLSTVTVIEIDPKQNFVISGSISGEVIVWKIGTESTLVVRSLSNDHTSEISSISISLDLLCYATASLDGQVCIYNLFNGNLLRMICHPESLPISQVVLSAHPIACVVFFSSKDRSFFSFSVNGQLLERVSSDFSIVTSPMIERNQLSTDMLVFLSKKFWI